MVARDPVKIAAHVNTKIDVFDSLSGTINRETSISSSVNTYEPYSSKSDRLYGIPDRNKVAINIWDDCDFTNMERESYIRHELWQWARIFANIVYRDTGIWVEWISYGNRHTTRYIAKWSTFVRWFLLCCTQT
jgi:hypothetical protein